MSNSNSDIKLLGQQVKVEAWDLCLDSKDRRMNSTPQRRALVHDFSDGLTLNWGNDYPGGVTINGLRQLKGNMAIEGNVEFKSDDPRDGLVNIIGGRSLDISADIPMGHDQATITTSYGAQQINSDYDLHVSAAKNLNFAGEQVHLKTKTGLKIEGGITVNNVRVKVETPNSSPTRPFIRAIKYKYKYIDIDLVHEILELQKEIISLKSRINALES